jgi:hypothetical protein
MDDYKKFSKDDYAAHDPQAKQAAKEYFESLGYQTKSTKNDAYTFDLMILKDGVWIEVEAEHKTPWKTKQWPSYFDTVDVPHRKWKNTSLIYILFNNSYNACAVAKMKDVQSSPCSRKNTTYTNNELFFNVPLDKFMFCTIKES